MEESITQVTEENAVVRDWSLRSQKAKGDSLKEGYISDLPERVTSNARQNNIEDLTKIWKQWDSDTRVVFTENHFWKVERTPFHMFSKTFAPLEVHIEKDWPNDVTEQQWVSVFQNLRAEDVTWRAPWIRPSVLLYMCRNLDWVPLLGLWGGVGYAPLMVQRQFVSR
ncbi:hypothetical protein Gotur_029151 [Gossypium turneri]